MALATSVREGQAEAVNIFFLIENRILREALARVFRKRTDFEVVGQCPYSETVTAQIAETLCNVLLLDHSTLLLSPPSMIPEIVANSPHVRIVLFGMEEDRQEFLGVVRAGVVGYLLKDASTADVLAAVRGVARGEAVCPPRLCLALLQQVAQESRITTKTLNYRLGTKFGLTRRQQQLVSLVALGMTNKEIASRLNLSECTVKNHVHRLLRQLDASSRYEAIENIRASGFVVVPQPGAVHTFPT